MFYTLSFPEDWNINEIKNILHPKLHAFEIIYDSRKQHLFQDDIYQFSIYLLLYQHIAML